MSENLDAERRPYELSALEQDGRLWAFWFSGPDFVRPAKLLYPEEECARRAKSLIFEALADAVAPEPVPGRPSRPAKSRPSRTLSIRTNARQWIHTFLEEGQIDSIAGRIIEGLLIGLIIANVAAVALETIASINSQYRGAFLVFERASLLVYSAEYFLRVWSCIEDPRISAKGPVRGRLAFVVQPLMVVDFLAFAPSVLGLFFGIDLRVLRIFRLFRLLKLARYSQALQALLNVLFVERSALLASGILLLAFTCLTGEMMYLVEGTAQPKTLGTMPSAMYWALTTLTTVGYGDVTPITPLGKFIAGLTMVIGLALFALPIGIIANGFVTGLSRRRFAITWSMLRRQPLLQDFEIGAMTDILEAPTALVIREHAQIVVEGKEATDFYLIVSGVGHGEIADDEYDVGPGDVVGAEALHHGVTYRRTVTAETDMRAIVFAGDELRRLCRKFPVLRRRVEAVLESEGLQESGNGMSRSVKELEAENLELQKVIRGMLIDKYA